MFTFLGGAADLSAAPTGSAAAVHPATSVHDGFATIRFFVAGAPVRVRYAASPIGGGSLKRFVEHDRGIGRNPGLVQHAVGAVTNTFSQTHAAEAYRRIYVIGDVSEARADGTKGYGRGARRPARHRSPTVEDGLESSRATSHVGPLVDRYTRFMV